jgi:hypothetical protein
MSISAKGCVKDTRGAGEGATVPRSIPMTEPHIAALYQLSTMPERDRRATEETAGRMFAAMVRAVRRLRGARVTGTAAVLQPETSTR